MTQAPEVRLILAVLDQAYDHASWHGTNLRGAIRRVSPAQAAWRPSARRHNIWELVVHAAYWKYAAWRRLTGTAPGSFPLKGSNWFRRPEQRTERAWRSDKALLDEMHALLRDRVGQLSPRDLQSTPRASKVGNFALLSGVAAHDLYHAGQIQLLKRLSTRA
jgi:uncharacterized damage-inducible protein DinB